MPINSKYHVSKKKKKIENVKTKKIKLDVKDVP